MSRSKIEVIEVGLRDGLQNEKSLVSLETKIEFAGMLLEAGVSRLELGAFVSPKWVPQMAETSEVVQGFYKLKESKRARGSVLVPNMKGFEEAIKTQVSEIALFAACSESFSRRNINCSIDESFARFGPVVREAKKKKLKLRGYLSVCFGCPFEGVVPEKKVIQLTERFFDLGVDEVSIGDTIGIAHVGQVKSLFKKLTQRFSPRKLAGHFHDTRGQALAHVMASLEYGIRKFDSSLGGLGGCPYAPGATGNLATEDLVYFLNGLGLTTGLDMDQLIKANHWMSQKMGKQLPSLVSRAAAGA